METFAEKSQSIQLRYTPSGIDTSELNSVYAKVIRDVEPGSHVLELGCYAGETGSYLAISHGCIITGIDYDEGALSFAAQKGVYAELKKIDLNRFNPSEFQGKFDFILMTDVLEHLVDPQDLLIKIKSLLNENGRIIISVPNIAHGAIKLKLLQNYFDYTDNGLLDRTHIRFFTLKNLLNLLADCGILISKMERITAHLDEAGQPFEVNSFPDSVMEFVTSDKESFTYQYYVVCRPSTIPTENIQQKNLDISDADWIIHAKQKRRGNFLKVSIRKCLLFIKNSL